MNSGAEGSGQDSQSGRPTPLTERRLLDVAQTAAYLGGLGEDTVRVLDASSVLTAARVVITIKGRAMRKVLFDRQALAGRVNPLKCGPTHHDPRRSETAGQRESR
jgi:hypothetical protein